MRQGNGKEVICYIPCTSTVGTGTATSTTANPTAQVSIRNFISLIQYVSGSIIFLEYTK